MAAGLAVTGAFPSSTADWDDCTPDRPLLVPFTILEGDDGGSSWPDAGIPCPRAPSVGSGNGPAVAMPWETIQGATDAGTRATWDAARAVAASSKSTESTILAAEDSAVDAAREAARNASRPDPDGPPASKPGETRLDADPPPRPLGGLRVTDSEPELDDPTIDECTSDRPSVPTPVAVRIAHDGAPTGRECGVAREPSTSPARERTLANDAVQIPLGLNPWWFVAGAGVLLVLAQVWWLLRGRIRPEKALDHPRRAQILDQVRRTPGIETNALARSLALSGTIARHHVRKLVSLGLLQLVKVDGRTALYPREWGRPKGLDGHYLLGRETVRRLREVLQTEGRLTQGQIAHRLGLSQQRVSRLLEQMTSARLVAPEGSSKPRRYSVLDGAVISDPGQLPRNSGAPQQRSPQ